VSLWTRLRRTLPALQNLGDCYYQLNWKTDKASVDTCKKITLKIGAWTGDGFNALFQFKK
jgi:hypothetical protein